MRMTPEQLTDALREQHGDNLISVVLYGSAAAGDYSRKFSDFNTLVVMRRIGPEDLRLGRQAARRWVRDGNPPPLLFTADRLARSADVFPMEFADIQEFHRVLHGDNPVAGMSISVDALRLELERELKGKLIRLREMYLACPGSDRAVRDLLARSASTFLTLFRHTLRLAGVTPLPARADAAAALGRHLGLDTASFADVRTLRETGKLPKGVTADDVFAFYLPFVERVVDAVDGWRPGQPLVAIPGPAAAVVPDRIV